jgi:hypothetical protein
VPEMPQPLKETAARSKSFTVQASGRKLFFLQGRIWIKHWIAPAALSPRIRHDSVEARVHFQVENQEQKTVAGDALKDYRGWLWFKPSVIQVKQKDKVGRLDIDAFEAMMMREDCDKGFFVSFDYSSDALQEIESFFKRSHKVIVALTVQEILDEHIAKKLV